MSPEELNSKVPGSLHFKWREVLYLPRWKKHHHPTEREYNNLVYIVQRIEAIRDILDKPIEITSGIRPAAYNELIGGAKLSPHIDGRALDFIVPGYSAQYVREMLVPHLEKLLIRMENKPTATWVHIDSRQPGPGGRYFKP